MHETNSGADQGNGEPRLTTHGAEPQMVLEQERLNNNGADRQFIQKLQQIVGKVRFGWAVAVAVLGPVFVFISMVIYSGWVSVPAKDSDMKLVQARLVNIESAQVSQGEAIRALNIFAARFDEVGKAQQRFLDRIDSKLDNIQDQHLAIMRAFGSPPETQKANPAPASPPPSPAQRPRARAPKKQESGLRLW